MDTVVGALVGFGAAVAVTNRRHQPARRQRVERALTAVERSREHGPVS